MKTVFRSSFDRLIFDDAFILMDAFAKTKQADGFVFRDEFDGTFTAFGTTFRVSATGDGFNQSLTRGTLDDVRFSVGNASWTFKNLDIDLQNLTKRARAEEQGDTGAIEKLLLKLDWKLEFNASDDVYSLFSDVGTSEVPFNLKGDDVVRLSGGDDFFSLGDGDDKGYGGKGDDILIGGVGRDNVYGGKNNDVLLGSGGRDSLFGGTGRDELVGGGGRDVLTGGTGVDLLSGGKGADVFRFKTGHGKDTIDDFDTSDIRERIDLSGVRAIRDYFDLRDNHLEDTDEGVVIKDNKGLEILLVNVSASDLSFTDFDF